MKRFVLAAAMAVSLSGCAHVFTPERCQAVLTTSQDAQTIIASLVDIWHFDAAKAAALVELIQGGAESAAVICGASNPGVV